MCVLNFMLFDISILTQKYFWKSWRHGPERNSLNLLSVSCFWMPPYSHSILSFSDDSNPISEKMRHY